MAEYAMAIDENRLEDWVELFDEACDYKVVTRENVEQNLPNVLMWCDNKNMLRDRVESYRHVNLYNPHYDASIGMPRSFEKGGVATVDASYSLCQRRSKAVAPLSVGRYSVEADSEGSPTLKRVMVIADTGQFPTPRHADLDRVVAAVDQQVGAGHEAGGVRCEEQRARGDFLRLRETVQQVLGT